MRKTHTRKGATVSALLVSSLLGAASLLAVTVGAQPAYAADAAMVPHSYLVFFDFNKSDLTPAALKIVDQAAADAVAGKVTTLQVTGYTDTVGSDAYNLRLSKRRAMAVQAELAKQGIPADAVAIFAKGKHDLLVPTADGVKEPQNRRVSIVYDTPAPAAEVAAEAKKDEAAATPPPEFGVWAQLEAGITANPDSPHSGVNYGHLFTDKSNQPVLNQLLLTAEKPLDTNATDWALGYRLQGMFGTDARYTHFLGELDLDIKERTQVDIVEAWAFIHAPLLTDGGIDIKIGQFVTYLGLETIDPSGDAFYSKSYIFNFGIPLKHTGAMAITHVNPTLDIYTGIDSGVNTSLGDGDENDAPAFQGGFGLNNLMGGKLTALVLTHMGPEDPNDTKHWRFLNDAVLTYKATDALTFNLELNYIREEAADADGYGIAGYVGYALSDTLTLNGRAEVWSDEKNFFVAAFPGNRTFVQLERGFGLDQPYIAAPAATKYSEFTAGITYKPVIAGLTSVAIRPEVRFDDALNGVKAYDDGRSTNQFTFGLDFIVKM